MAISKSQITSKLKRNGLQCYSLTNTVFYVPSRKPSTTLNQIYGMLSSDGAKPVPKSKYSAVGEVQINNYTIITTPDKFAPRNPTGISSPNAAVKNRLAFGAMVQEVLHSVAKPLTIVFDGGKKLTVKNVTDTKFHGDGVADFTLRQGTKQIPLAVHLPKGTYRHAITGRYLDTAYEALEKVTQDGDIDASMTGDTMTLNAPVVYAADNRSIRELMFQDIRGGLGIIGEFKSTDFKYDGRTHTLTVKCDRVYENPLDLKASDKPYFVIVNNDKGQIGELKGLQLDLVPKTGLPNRIVLAKL